jgi:dynein heavy chain
VPNLLLPTNIRLELPCVYILPLQDGKIYTFEELSDSSAALISQRHPEMRDAGKEIGKLLSSSNRVLKVRQ